MLTQITLEDWEAIRYFSKKEFDCQHTGNNLMKLEFLRKLEELRDLCGFPFVITSGYRDPKHPIEAKKAILGTHAQGIAADIKIGYGGDRRKLVEKALELGFGGVGVAKDFVHVDIREGLPVLWGY